MKENEILDKQRQIWNTFSSGWDKWDDLLMESMHSLGNTMIETLHLSGNEHILDVASGTGEPGTSLAQKLPNGHVTGCDLSEEMVKIANRRTLGKNISNYKSICCDATNMPFEDASFDHVICRYGIMFFPDIQKGINEMKRVVNPGGRITLAVWGDPSKNPFLTVMAATVKDILSLPDPPADAPGVFRCAKPGTTEHFMKLAGLQDIKEDPIQGIGAFESVDQYWEIMSDVAGPVMEHLLDKPDEIKMQVKEAVFEKAQSFLRDGKLYLDWQANLATGIK